MAKSLTSVASFVALAVLSTACTSTGHKDVARAAEYGASPNLVVPESSLLPTINPAEAIGWVQNDQPTATEGLVVKAFARHLDHPRWLLPLPNGDVLVAESNRPSRSGGFRGLKGWIADKIMDYAGAGTRSADRITLLRDSDGDGVADIRSTLLDNLTSPLGMTLMGGHLYVANTDRLERYRFKPGMTSIETPGELVAPLPAGEINHHWTKGLLADKDNRTLYVSVGSNSNIAENGLDQEQQRAAILAIDANTGHTTVYASGLRNPVGMDWHPTTGDLWTVVNERDELGDQLVPDYLTAVAEGDFFGWPWFYWGDRADPRLTAPQSIEPGRAPDYALGAHTASLGLAFYDHDEIPALRNCALVGQHGSWNRREPAGYKVVAVCFSSGKPEGEPIDILTDFLNDRGQARGRPVGVAVDASGNILVADDAGNTIWRVSAEGHSAQQ
jgi:glucose/arabinose dehydrogenase